MGKLPHRAIQFLPILEEDRLKREFFQRDKSPPEFPIDGLAHHPISSSCHNDLIVFGVKFSILVS